MNTNCHGKAKIKINVFSKMNEDVSKHQITEMFKCRNVNVIENEDPISRTFISPWQLGKEMHDRSNKGNS